MNHNVLVNHFEQFSCMICFDKEGNNLWKSLWVFVIWCIWKRRNKVIFNQVKIDAKEIFTMAQVQSRAWMKHKFSLVGNLFSKFLLTPP